MEKIPPKERILITAARLFASQGYAGTGLRELAAEAEVNLAMINYFFGTKKGLLKEILDHFFAGYLAVAEQELIGSAPLTEKLQRFISSAITYFAAEQEGLLVTITELPHDDPEIVEHKAQWAMQMAAIINREVCIPLAETTGRIISPTCIGSMLTSLMASRFLFSPLMKQINRENENSFDSQLYTEIIKDMFIQGLLYPGQHK